MPGRFFDTNVILYLTSPDLAKAARAEQLLADGGGISVQVLNEAANVLRRKFRRSWPETHVFLSALRGLVTVYPVTTETHEAGLGIAERYGLSLYDSMIAAAALYAECNTLWSEDMQHGMVLEGGLRILNPFIVGEGAWG
jgi:predicted nucleic acid-binding protein